MGIPRTSQGRGCILGEAVCGWITIHRVTTHGLISSEPPLKSHFSVLPVSELG